MRFGVCTGPENAQIIKDAGFDYIELSVSGGLKPFEDEAAVIPAIQEQLKGLRTQVGGIQRPVAWRPESDWAGGND